MNNIIDSIRLSGTTYQIQGEVTVDTALDSGSTNPVENRAIYNKIDEVEQVTAAALNELNEALSGKQDTLSAGTNITISGNVISAEGGGKAIEAGRGISITTGATADTVSLGVPISAGTGTNSIIEGYYTTASGQLSHAEGYYTTASGQSSHAEGDTTVASGISSHAEGYRTLANGRYSHAEGNRTSASGQSSHAEGERTKASGSSSHAEGEYTTANGNYSHSEGYQTITTNDSEHASGQYNVSNSASTEFGDSGNTLFSVGNGDWSARHNAFEIRQNGDIYLTSGGTDIKLQDHLGGGGSVTVDTELDSGSTNPVQNKVIYSKIDEVEQVTAAALNNINDRLTEDEEVTAAALNELNEALSGKQDTLIAGTNITISGNVISAEGGGSITIDPSLDSGSTNPVANSAITTALNDTVKLSNLTTYYINGFTNYVNRTIPIFHRFDINNQSNGNAWWFGKINDKYVITTGQTSVTPSDLMNLQVVETSAITTSITSSSTDSQVPSAKAVYDNFGGLKLVKLTEAEYNALATKDSSTLYIIVN